MNSRKNCKRSIAVVIKGPSYHLEKARADLVSTPVLKGATHRLKWLGDSLIIEACLADTQVDRFLSALGRRMDRYASMRGTGSSFDMTVIDEDKSECALAQDEIELLPGWKVVFTSGPLAPPSAGTERTIFLVRNPDAFGTGLHPSTRLACKALFRAQSEGLLKGARVLDVGAGSGILSILCALVGAQAVTGIDVDERITEAARNNANMNGVESKVSFLTASLCKLQQRELDVIVANLTPSVLLELLDEMAGRLGRHGWLILSGHSPRLVPEISRRTERHGLEMMERMSESGWSAEIFSFRSRP